MAFKVFTLYHVPFEYIGHVMLNYKVLIALLVIMLSGVVYILPPNYSEDRHTIALCIINLILHKSNASNASILYPFYSSAVASVATGTGGWGGRGNWPCRLPSCFKRCYYDFFRMLGGMSNQLRYFLTNLL